MTDTTQQFGPVYNVAGATLVKYRKQAGSGLATLSQVERRAYGEAVERAILAKQRSELQGSMGPIKPRVRCASGTGHSDGADIHEAIRQQQRNALLAWPGKVRRNRTDVEWRQMYQEAMEAKAAAMIAQATAILAAYRRAA